jgi:type III secretory pathway component EscV
MLLLNEGIQSPLAMYVTCKKIIEYYSTLVDKLKDSATDSGYKFNKQITLGAKVEIRNTGDKLDYSSDPIYAELEAKLKARKELLNFSYKSYSATIFDEEGIEVPKVKVKTNGVESLFVTF